MRTDSNTVYVLSSARIPFAKSQTAYSEIPRQDLMVASLNNLVKKAGLKGKRVGDIALGAVINSAMDWNLARESVLSTEIHPESPAYNLQRACGTGMEAVWHIALKAHTGSIDFGIAGGVDTNSDLPIEVSDRLRFFLLRFERAKSFGRKLKVLTSFSPFSLKPKIPTVTEPRTLLSMGQHTELMVKEWNISREEQDQWAYESHVKGAKAYGEGFYKDLVEPFGGLERDGILRGDASLEKLARLKPAFDSKNGTLTAGNSSPLTDGSSCVLVGNQKGADQLGLKPLAKILDMETAAVDFVHGAGLLMAPTIAIPRLLARNKLTPKDFDYFEIHEAFAGQVLSNLKALESEKYCKEVLGLPHALGPLDRSKINVVGSSIALGHPFAATGARIAGTLAKLLSNGGNKRGLISICTAGGMTVAGIFESA